MRSVRIVFALCGLILVGLGVYSRSFHRNEMVVDGQTLSEQEVSSGFEETRDLLAKADGEPMKASQMATNTKLGSVVKRLTAKIAEIEAWHQRALKEAGADRLASAAAFKSPQTLRQELGRVDKTERVETEWVDRRTAAVTEFTRLFSNTPRSATHTQQSLGVLRDFLGAEKALFDSMRTYLRFGLAKSPLAEPSKEIVYRSDVDLPKAQSILKEIDRRQKDVERQTQAMQARVTDSLKLMDEASSNSGAGG